jgi:hypothetical protein
VHMCTCGIERWREGAKENTPTERERERATDRDRYIRYALNIDFVIYMRHT